MPHNSAVSSPAGKSETDPHLLRNALILNPSDAQSLAELIRHRLRRGDYVLALIEGERLTRLDDANVDYLYLQIDTLKETGYFAASFTLYQRLVTEICPEDWRCWLSYGNLLIFAGRSDAAIDCFRQVLAIRPQTGAAYWGLASVKHFRFTPEEVTAMEYHIAREDLTPNDHRFLHFALARAYQSRRDFPRAFDHYATGNQLRRATLSYRANLTSELVARMKNCLSRQFFQDRAGFGCPSSDPIFIVGMPRSGSTLIEQILASHSKVEGTMELNDLSQVITSMDRLALHYPESLEELTEAQCFALGARYIEQTRIQRKTTKPKFTDKMPVNFFHVAAITLFLPNARIIDIRRHPMASCFSSFTHHFMRKFLNFSFCLNDLGRYYADYVELMDFFAETLPGRVHRIHYEALVDDTENTVRRLLDHCGLEFEENCLRFWQTPRNVATPSVDQVRRPIFRESLSEWRAFEPWLEPLRNALGKSLEEYPYSV